MRLNHKAFINLHLALAFACAPQMQDESCTSGTYYNEDSKVSESKDFSFEAGIIEIHLGDSKAIECNASIEPIAFETRSGEMEMRVTTGKHCFRPTETQDIKLNLYHKGAFFYGDLSGYFIKDVKTLSQAMGYRKVDYSEFLTHDPMSYTPEDFDPDGKFVKQQDIIKFPHYGRHLDEIANDRISHPCMSYHQTACFYNSDALTFTATFSIEDRSDMALKALNKAWQNYNNHNHSHGPNTAKDLLNVFERRSRFALETLVGGLIQSAANSCDGTPTLPDLQIICEQKSSLSRTYANSPTAFEGFKYYSSAKQILVDFEKDEEILENELVNILETIFKLSSTISINTSKISVLNYASNGKNDARFGQFDLNRISFQELTTSRTYGLTAVIKPSEFKFDKGDSGSLLLVDGVPFAVLSIFDGEPVSNGLAYTKPKVDYEKIVLDTHNSENLASGSSESVSHGDKLDRHQSDPSQEIPSEEIKPNPVVVDPQPGMDSSNQQAATVADSIDSPIIDQDQASCVL